MMPTLPAAIPSSTFQVLVQQCAPSVHPATLQAIVRTESGFNPFAIGVVGGRLVRQPRNRDEAVATVKALEAGGWNYSMGLGQVNRSNLARYGLTTDSVFDPCANLRTGAAILGDCYARAAAQVGGGQQALQAAFSCYYSGSFARGFRADPRGTSYVQRVVDNATVDPAKVTGAVTAIPVVPAVAPAVASTATVSPVRIIGRSSQTGKPSLSTAAPAAPPEARPRHAWDTFGEFGDL
jgi:type IV secretion system protein VirB1